MRTPRLTMTKRTGTEGLSYDPYHFEEFTITTCDRVIVVHTGLSEWAKSTYINPSTLR